METKVNIPTQSTPIASAKKSKLNKLINPDGKDKEKPVTGFRGSYFVLTG